MLLNFLNSNLLPKIVEKPLSSDNYEVENLISDKFINRSRGFIAFPSIKPPVQIEFEFICNVNIHYIVLNTTVGNQKCSGIEVLAKTSKNTPFLPIGKAVYSENGVFFCNKKFYSKDSPPPNFTSINHHLSYFRSDNFRVFFNASAIRIIIFRTTKSVPCIAGIEVWGEPSKTCSEKTKKTIKHLTKKNCLSEKVDESIQKQDFQIPEDFKDNLTYELMTIPMTLPSGKTIDQITLEKHIASEAIFRRKPCDPFTGVKFTHCLKPILNVALKSRIDMFLLQNSHRTEFFNLRRSLGKRKAEITGETSGTNKKLKTEESEIQQVIDLAKTNPDFYSFSSKEREQKCDLCKKQFPDFYYRIPCSHEYCRTCLLKICKVMKCSVCEKPYVKSDVQKINK